MERFASGFSLRNTGEVRIGERERERETERERWTYFKIPFIVHFLCYVFNIEYNRVLSHEISLSSPMILSGPWFKLVPVYTGFMPYLPINGISTDCEML